MKSFASDNYAGVLPEIIEAIQKVNHDHARAYGNDEITKQTKDLFKKVFNTNDLEVYFVFNGTGANILSMLSTTQSFNSVLCSQSAHLINDESTSPETVTGCRFVPLETSNETGKIDLTKIEETLQRLGDMHAAQPKVISISQPTEYGTIYTFEELKQLSKLAKKHNLYIHMDGARLFNACVSYNCEIKDMTTNAGIDILSLGGTKIGLMYGEAVVVLNKQIIDQQHMSYRHKQVMQLASKQRFIACQFQAILTNDLWRTIAKKSNEMTQILLKKLLKYSPEKVRITKPTETNAIFAIIPEEWIIKLQKNFHFIHGKN